MKNYMATFIIGMVLFFATIGSGIFMSGDWESFVFIPALILVMGVAGGLGLASYRGGGVIKFIEASKKHIISASILGTIVELIHVLQTLLPIDGTNWAYLLSMVLLCPLYGGVLYCVADAIVAKGSDKETI